MLSNHSFAGSHQARERIINTSFKIQKKNAEPKALKEMFFSWERKFLAASGVIFAGVLISAAGQVYSIVNLNSPQRKGTRTALTEQTTLESYTQHRSPVEERERLPFGYEGQSYKSAGAMESESPHLTWEQGLSLLALLAFFIPGCHHQRRVEEAKKRASW